MKSFINIALISYLIFDLSITYAQNRKFGIGFIVGEPTGISSKYWTSNANALAFGLGWSIDDYRIYGYNPDYHNASRLHLHVDYLWHSFRAIKSNGEFPLFYGIGGRINSGPAYSASFGVRGIFGIAWSPRSAPIDVYFETVPTLFLITSTGFGIDAALGARYYF